MVPGDAFGAPEPSVTRFNKHFSKFLIYQGVNMSFTKKVEFSNFTLKFGEKYVLLDMFEGVVWPSFSDEENLRISRDSQYFF